ncbi:hypothetical protein IQ254_10690 [Nodosilinea sp. LEGE 07088]|uniref:hypothetical protein n=1 Tax=Nodosilinea sp. LEGE 07088 TaxID=2777968 RepID=UPI001882EE55|nr:hypothetical protein [Nodosilinea sp. LEGE 07088]MBE9137676.1 hypothetical protein [Nodosilinea sp. LEGE 07088]
MSTTNRLPTEVLDCLAAHLLAVAWLADEVQDLGPWTDLSRDDLIAEARKQGFYRYRNTPPQGIAAIAAQALTDYAAIAALDDDKNALDDDKNTPDES